jgi:hypothetical protein
VLHLNTRPGPSIGNHRSAAALFSAIPPGANLLAPGLYLGWRRQVARLVHAAIVPQGGWRATSQALGESCGSIFAWT